jgi:hypothetical protein
MARPNLTDAVYAHKNLFGSSTPGAYALAVSTTSAALTLPVGTFKVWLQERAAGTSVFCKVGAAATVPADGTIDASVFGFPGDESAVVRIEDADTKTLNAILTTGTGTLHVVRVG